MTMAGSVNKVILVGNLGADPEVRTTQNGQAAATLSIATSDHFTDRAGQRQERTEWHRVVLWAKLAELAQRYLAKGRKVYVEGRLQTRSWEDQQTGQKKYATEIVAREMTFLDAPAGQGQGPPQGGYGRPPANAGAAPQQRGGYGAPPPGGAARRPPAGGYGRAAQPAGPPANADPTYFDDDIPF